MFPIIAFLEADDFEDTIRRRENSDFSLRNTNGGPPVNESVTSVINFVKGIGPVRIESGGQVFNLSGYSKRFQPINNPLGIIPYLESSLSQADSTCGRIVGNLRRLSA